jgi:hypothetical protein
LRDLLRLLNYEQKKPKQSERGARVQFDIPGGRGAGPLAIQECTTIIFEGRESLSSKCSSMFHFGTRVRGEPQREKPSDEADGLA